MLIIEMLAGTDWPSQDGPAGDRKSRGARFDHVLDFPLVLKSENGVERKTEVPPVKPTA